MSSFPNLDFRARNYRRIRRHPSASEACCTSSCLDRVMPLRRLLFTSALVYLVTGDLGTARYCSPVLRIVLCALALGFHCNHRQLMP